MGACTASPHTRCVTVCHDVTRSTRRRHGCGLDCRPTVQHGPPFPAMPSHRSPNLIHLQFSTMTETDKSCYELESQRSTLCTLREASTSTRSSQLPRARCPRRLVSSHTGPTLRPAPCRGLPLDPRPSPNPPRGLPRFPSRSRGHPGGTVATGCATRALPIHSRRSPFRACHSPLRACCIPCRACRSPFHARHPCRCTGACILPRPTHRSRRLAQCRVDASRRQHSVGDPVHVLIDLEDGLLDKGLRKARGGNGQ